MFKIGEFSKLTQISVRMLRYYDETGLLKPEEIDPFTGYRLYSARQIPVLNRIIFLRDLGFQVAEIGQMIGSRDEGGILDRLNEKKREIEQQIGKARGQLEKIELVKKDMGQPQMDMHYNVTIKAVPSCLVLSLRRTMPDYYGEERLWKEMAEFARENRIQVSDQTFTIYHDLDYREQDVDMEICAPVCELGESRDGFLFRRTEPVSLMACTMVYGPFDRIAGAYLAFAGWLQEHSQY